MTLELYTDILSAGIIGVAVISIGVLIGFVSSGSIRTQIEHFGYFGMMKLIGVIAITCTAGALVYQYVYDTPVCELCWWQRIFMFPIDVIVLMGLVFADSKMHYSVLVLAAWGLMITAYHYYYHFSIFVLDRSLSLSCSGYGTLPSCTDTPVISFGFMTIPGMAMLGFVTILCLGVVAHLISHNNSQ